jgi:hypothetical protein
VTPWYWILSTVAFFVAGFLAVRDGADPGDIVAYALFAALAWPLIGLIALFWSFGVVMRFLFRHR